MAVRGIVPIKPFRAAKGRLAAELSPETREAIARMLARRTVAAVAEADLEPIVIAADDEVTRWAVDLGVASVFDHGAPLNEAVRIALKPGQSWLVLHADLPLVDQQAIRAVVSDDRPALAPSPDGGTPLLFWRGDSFRFEYGPQSFARHLRTLAPHHPRVVIDPRVGFDLDLPRHLGPAARANPELAKLLSTLPRS